MMAAKKRQELVEVFGLLLADMAHKWRRVLDQRLKPKGLSQATWRTIYYVQLAGTGILQKDLAIAIGIVGPSLVRLLDSLEDDGLLVRRPTPNDRRGKIILLTPEGEAKYQEFRDIADAAREELLHGISGENLGACLDVLTQIGGNADHIGSGGKDG
jgi:MarR family transcriptional regulator for hemolysin